MTEREAAAMRALKAARDGFSKVSVVMALAMLGMPGGERRAVEALEEAGELNKAASDADVLLTLHDEGAKEAQVQ